MTAKEKSTFLRFIHRYPLAWFFILAFALGTGAIGLVAQGAVPPSLALASVLSASIAGIIMTGILDGKAGLKLMLSRLTIWHAGIGTWLGAILLPIPAFLVGSFFNPMFNGDPISLSSIKPSFNLLPLFIVFFIVSGLGQELGWTGFLTPRLQARFSALTTSVIRSVLVGIWHVPLLVFSGLQPNTFPDFPYGAWMIQEGFPVTFSVVLVLILPWSIFQTWMFNNTKGSLLLAAVLHASEIWVATCMASMGIDKNNLANYWGYGTAMILTAILLVLLTGPEHLSRTQKRIVDQHMPLQEGRENR